MHRDVRIIFEFLSNMELIKRECARLRGLFVATDLKSKQTEF